MKFKDTVADDKYAYCFVTVTHPTFDSSVGRAVDCSCDISDIHRSLVQIRLEGFLKKFSQRVSYVSLKRTLNSIKSSIV